MSHPTLDEIAALKTKAQTFPTSFYEARKALVEMAVEDGILAKTALAVPYGNLASMYEQMGEATNASKYAKMADTASKSAAQLSPRTGRMLPTTVRTASTQGGGMPSRTNGQMNGQQSRMNGVAIITSAARSRCSVGAPRMRGRTTSTPIGGRSRARTC